MIYTFVINSVVEWFDGNADTKMSLERILWIDGAAGRAVVVSIDDKNALPAWKDCEEIELALQRNQAVLRPVDPMTRYFAPDSEYVKKHSERMEENWAIIEDLVHAEPQIYDSNYRGILIRDTMAKFHVTKVTIYRLLRRYWIGGKTKYALLPNYERSGGSGKERISTGNGPKRGRPSRIAKHDPEKHGVNVTEDTKHIFRLSIHQFYDQRSRIPLKRAYDQMIERYFTLRSGDANRRVPVETVPSFGQFKYWFTKEFNLRKTLTARHGEKQYNLRNRAVLGSSNALAFGPGSMYQIDATIGDVYLVSSFDRSRIIGRPVVYVVIDVFSRMIVGFHVGLEGPSWVGAMVALANTMADKVKLCEEYGIEIAPEQWPAKHLPESILADRGEMISHASDRIVNGLGITVHNTPPYRADWKGIVEQSFRIANLEVIHWLPGSVQSRFRERGEHDNRLDAKLDLRDFRRLLLLMILKYNESQYMDWYHSDQVMIASGVKPIPSELWEWGIIHRTGHLRQLPEDMVKLQLLPKERGVVTPYGIRLKGMHYSCDLALREQWFETARKKGVRSVDISFDPRLIDVVYLHKADGTGIEPCALLEREARYKGQCVEDIEELQEMEKLQRDFFEPKRLEFQVNFDAEVQRTVDEASQKTMDAMDERLSKSQRVANIRGNRAEEKEKMRATEAWDLREKRVPSVEKTAKVQSVVSDGQDRIDKRILDLQLLRSLRDEQMEDE